MGKENGHVFLQSPGDCFPSTFEPIWQAFSFLGFRQFHSHVQVNCLICMKDYRSMHNKTKMNFCFVLFCFRMHIVPDSA
jgi:hypothetical protein